MTRADLTHIYVVLDRSGSMITIKDDTEGGYDAFIAEQRKAPGVCLVTLNQFDTEYTRVYEDIDVDVVPGLVLHPRGGTALLDAIGRTIVEAGEKLAKLDEDERPGSVIVVVLTDGEENSSREFDLPQIEKMIKRQQDTYHWLFVYLGANQDAIKTGARMGFRRGQTMTYTGQNVNSTISSMSANTTAYREAKASGVDHDVAVAAADFTDEQRTDATK